MKWLLICLTAFSLSLFAKEEPAFHYPDARKSDQADDYHGTKVADPYRWLEEPDSAESRAWIEAENKVTFDFSVKFQSAMGSRRVSRSCGTTRSLASHSGRRIATSSPVIPVCRTRALFLSAIT